MFTLGQNKRHYRPRYARSISELSSKELEHLAELNRQLIRAEQWAADRGKCLLNSYYGHGYKKRYYANEQDYEDVEVEANLKVIRRSDSSLYRENEDNFIAEVWLFLNLFQDHGERETDNYDWHPVYKNKLKDGIIIPTNGERICWLFHELCENILDFDFDLLLDIGGFWLDVVLVQQFITNWDSTKKDTYNENS
jgi:hypothetical protein